jgi:phosphatidylserine/phosphatidylglycerophosphate/cardiolipin synthase-like enzyme
MGGAVMQRTEIQQVDGEAATTLGRGDACWRRSPGERVAPLIDGAAYFAALAEALSRARHSVLLIAQKYT